MATPILTTKPYVPPVRPELVPRPRLIEQLNVGLHRKLTLVSAPAGFGKTTLVSEWIASCGPRPRFAWLSPDEGNNDSSRFLACFVAALQTVTGNVGQGVLAATQSPGAVNVESVLTALLKTHRGLDGWIAVGWALDLCGVGIIQVKGDLGGLPDFKRPRRCLPGRAVW